MSTDFIIFHPIADLSDALFPRFAYGLKQVFLLRPQVSGEVLR